MKLIFIKTLFILFALISSASAQDLNLKNYDTYLKSLDITKYYSTLIAANKYKELFTSENYSVNDSAFVLFETFYGNITEKMNELHDEDTTNYSVLFNDTMSDEIDQIPNLILNYRKDLIENGFDIAISEGKTWIKQDRNFISKNFYRSISDSMKDYCTFLNMVTREETLDDGTLTISPTRLAERIIWLESFLDSNPQFILNSESNSYYKYFLYLLLNGTGNSAILDDNDLINQNFANAYNYIILEHSQSTTAKLISPFCEYLKNNQKTKAYDLLEKYKNEKIIEY